MDDVLDDFGVSWNPRSLVPVVKIVGRRGCWVSLPANLAKELHNGGVQLPAVLRFTTLDEADDGKGRYICWDGGSCANGYVEVPCDVARLIGLNGGSRIKLEVCHDIPDALSAQVTLQRQEDWEVLTLEQAAIEETIRNQVGAVFAGQSFPLYLRNQAPFVLTPVTVTPGPIARLTGITELEVVAPAEHSLSVQNASKSKNDELVSSTDIKEYSIGKQSWWLRLQEADTRTVMGIVESSSPENSSIFGEGSPHHVVESMLSTACIICPQTASVLGVSEGSTLNVKPQIVQRDTASDEVECVGLRVVVNSTAAVGHIVLSSCVRQCVGVEVFEYVEVMPSNLPRNQKESVQVHLHPVCWNKSKIEARAGEQVEKDANDKPVRSLHVSEQIHLLSGDLKLALNEFFLAWVSSQLELQKRFAGSKIGWGEILLHNGSVIHMLGTCENKASNTDIVKKEFTYVVELSTPSGKDLPSKGKPCLVSQAHLTDHLVSGQVSIRLDHAYSIDVKNEPTFPLALKRLSSPPWLQNHMEHALSHIAPALDSDVHINVPKLGNAQVLPVGVFVTGAKGSGKTSFVSGIARVMHDDPRIQAVVCYISLQELSISNPSASRGKAAQEFLLAEVGKCIRKAPAVMILDDLEAVFPSADDEDRPAIEGMSSNLASWLLELIESIYSAGYPIVFMATCESMDTIARELRDNAQFHHVELPAHSSSSRTEIFAKSLKERGATLTRMPLQDIADWGTGYEAGDLDTLADRAIRLHIVKNMTGESYTSSSTPLVHVGHLDVSSARQGFKPAALWSASSNTGKQGIDGWEDVGGLHTVREVLHEAIELPIRCSGILSLCPLRLRTGVLLFGPPGCGKTYIVSAAVQALGVRFITVKGPELLNKYIGASEAGVRDVFKRAASCAPCILFFDEFEALAPARGHDSTGVSDRVVNQLLTEMDGVEGLQGVCIIAASSRPDMIDPALLRPGRLDRWVHCPLPNKAERLEILLALSRKLTISDDVSMEHLAAKTEGLSGADLRGILADAHLHAVQGHLGNLEHSRNDNGFTLRIGARDFDAAVQSARPSISSSRAATLEQIYSKFIGSKAESDPRHSMKNVGQRVTLA